MCRCWALNEGSSIWHSGRENTNHMETLLMGVLKWELLVLFLRPQLAFLQTMTRVLGLPRSLHNSVASIRLTCGLPRNWWAIVRPIIPNYSMTLLSKTYVKQFPSTSSHLRNDFYHMPTWLLKDQYFSAAPPQFPVLLLPRTVPCCRKRGALCLNCSLFFPCFFSQFSKNSNFRMTNGTTTFITENLTESAHSHSQLSYQAQHASMYAERWQHYLILLQLL